MSASLMSNIKDPEWIKRAGEKDPLLQSRKSYFLPAKAIKPSVQCFASPCSVQASVRKEMSSTMGHVETVPQKQPMMLCFCCNRTYHLVCLKMDLETLSSESVPYTCPKCNANNLNEAAVAYFQSNEWKKSLAVRRKLFLLPEAIKENPQLLEAQSTDDEFDPEDRDAFSSVFDSSLYVTMEEFQQQKEETVKAGEVIIQEMKKNEDLEAKVKQLEAELAAKRADESASKSHISFNVPTSTFCEQKKIVTVTDIMSSFYLQRNKRANQEGVPPSHAIPMPQPRENNFTRPDASSSSGQSQAGQSFIEGVDVSGLDLTQKVLLEQANAQKAATAANQSVAHSMNLTEVRKSLPKIASFSGDARDWIRFKRDIKRYQEIGQYDEGSMKMYIARTLTGEAADRVGDMIDLVSLENTMAVLEDTFGDPTTIIRKCSEDILAIKLGTELYKEDAVTIVTKIQKYFAACIYAEVGMVNTNSLAKHIVEQFNPDQRERYREHHRERTGNENPNANQLEDLESVFTFLEKRRKNLDEKKTKTVVVAATSFASAPPTSQSNGKPDCYQIKDLKEAKFMGYNTQLLASYEKKCEICSRNHYTVECKNYRAMDKTARNDFINQRGICRNCVVTRSHRANDCNLKPSCGSSDKSGRCLGKHHVSLHRAKGGQPRFNRRNNTNSNSNRAANIANSSASSNANGNEQPQRGVEEAINSAPPASQNAQGRLQGAIRGRGTNEVITATTFSMNELSLISPEREGTIKVFKTQFIGPEQTMSGHAVGDSASEATLLTEELRRDLGISGESCQIKLKFADASTKTINAQIVTLTIKGVHRNAKPLTLKNCFAVSSKDFNLPPRSLDMTQLKRQFPYLKPVKCHSYNNIVPSLLIGSKHASVMESCGPLYEGKTDQPVGLLAKLGWSVYGGDPNGIGEFAVTNVQMDDEEKSPKESALSNEDLYDLLSFFNSIENLGLRERKARRTEDELKAIEIMEEETAILPNGAIEVPLVWNRFHKQIPRLPDNFPMVMKRQMQHEIKLSKNPEHLRIFNEKFKELIGDGYVRPANANDLRKDWPNVNYLPMSLVVNNNKIPVGYRIVFDAAARYQNTSLNMNLLKGPDLLINIFEPLIRMRTKQVAITADVKAMFMRMKVNLRDQQAQRVLWRESPNEEMKIFIFSSVVFGPTCSPFQSQFCKNLAAGAWQDQYPQAASTIKKFVYMDDLLTSASTTEEALELAQQCIAIFKSIDWELRQFQSNDIEFLKRLPNASVKQESIPLVEDADQKCIAKVLGCVWDTRSDNFVFLFDKNLFIRIVKECQHKPTKRDQSSTIARIFDVLGLICHFVIRGRILLQESWESGIDWDQTISESQHKRWLEWLNEIEKVASLKIPRKLCAGSDLWETENVELHVFCDAGAEAYAAVAYLVTTHQKRRSSSIVMARAHVTPLRLKSKTKVTEIPRLELYAALLAARLCDTLTNNFPNLEMRRYLWSDSEVVLKWITNPNMQLKAYATSPVEEILTKTDKKEWFYVPSKLNAADIATKFKKFDFSDSNSTWFKGPEFLLHEKEIWPTMVSLPPTINVTPAEESQIVCATTVEKIEFTSPIKLPHPDHPIAHEYYIGTFKPSIRSTWIKLVRATARGLKIFMDGFMPLIMTKKYAASLKDPAIVAEIREKNFNYLTPHDLERAELFLARRAQRLSFPHEYEALRHGKPLENREMLQLGVFLDDQGVMRINSRVELSTNLYPQRFAPLLPRENAYTSIFLRHVHCEFNHIHLESQLAAVKSKYWISMLRPKLKTIQHKCNFCVALRTQPYKPKMAALPDCRVDPLHFPFQTTGIDCAGPITVHIYNRPKKIWILIFACTRTRFIQLHILESLEAIKVLEAIAMLWASNGPIQTIISDRGTNFQGASRFIREEHERAKDALHSMREKLCNLLAEKYRLDWQFLPAHSPWMGGFYERLIKEVKRSIFQTLEQKKLTKTELNIALQDACHRINCRPLTHNTISNDEEEVLTPHHLARGRAGYPYLPSITPIAPTNYQEDRSVYRRGRLIADDIARRFTLGYLPVLTKRLKWFQDKTTPLKNGDLVLLIEPNQTRREWRRGKIVKIYNSRDRRGRVADVLVANGVVKVARAVQRLAKLEISHDDQAA